VCACNVVPNLCVRGREGISHFLGGSPPSRLYATRVGVNVIVKALDGQLSSVKLFMTQCFNNTNDTDAADADADDNVIVPHLNVDDYVVLSSDVEPMLSVDKLPPNRRVLLQNLYDEVRDVLSEKLTEVDSMRDCLQKTAVAYKVTIFHHCLLCNSRSNIHCVP